MHHNTVCEICLGLDDTVKTFDFPCNCSGLFHQQCLNDWETTSSKTCPICKVSFAPKEETTNLSDKFAELQAESEAEQSPDEPEEFDVSKVAIQCTEATFAETCMAYAGLFGVISIATYAFVVALTA